MYILVMHCRFRFYNAVVNMVNLEKEEGGIKDFEMDANETCAINVSCSPRSTAT